MSGELTRNTKPKDNAGKDEVDVDVDGSLSKLINSKHLLPIGGIVFACGLSCVAGDVVDSMIYNTLLKQSVVGAGGIVVAGLATMAYSHFSGKKAEKDLDEANVDLSEYKQVQEKGGSIGMQVAALGEIRLIAALHNAVENVRSSLVLFR
ncbi:MAG: hypothetical protein GY804_05660 [Alphaproteobacteria bacterium]|nr:hypothetical protein [Alphaproteobacteria bacterium]